MTRRVSKHGTTYTEGSHATPGAGYPTTCSTCGERIYTSRQPFQHHWQDGIKHAWHTDCPPPWKETPANPVSLHPDRVPLRDILVATGLAAGTSNPKGDNLKHETETEPVIEPAPEPEPEPDTEDDEDEDAS